MVSKFTRLDKLFHWTTSIHPSRLDKKLRENLRDTRNSLFINDGMQAGQYSFYRPVLVLLDRQFDLATPLHHTWTYQAMAHDVLKYSLNR